MKKVKLPFLPAVVALYFLSCTISNDSPDQLLRKLMEQKAGENLKQPFKEVKADGKLSFRWESEMESSGLIGSWRKKNDYLIVAIEEFDWGSTYATGIFEMKGGDLKSVFATDWVFGKLDTLVDLDKDGTDEFVLNEYTSTTAGFDSYKVLYARRDKGYLEKIDTLGRHYLPAAAWDGILSTLKFEDNTDYINIYVHTENPNGDPTGAKLVLFDWNYRWRPPQLIMEATHRSPDFNEGPDELTAGEERESVYETREYADHVIRITYIPGFEDGGDWFLKTYEKSKEKIDELALYSEGSGGVAEIMIIQGGSYQFESDTLLRRNLRFTFTGPSLNGHHITSMDSFRRDANGKYTSLKGEPLDYESGEFHSGHVEFYKITKAGKIERVMWSPDWSSLDKLSKEELVFIRNEIFARHGHIFQTAFLNDYFRRYDWYNPRFNDVTDKLSNEEKRFVAHIKNLEDKR